MTGAGAALGRRLVAALVAATRASPGESGEGLLSAAGRFEAGAGRKLERAGIGIPDPKPDSYDEEESARGLLDRSDAGAA